MFLDKLLQMADAASSTVTAAFTDVVPLSARSDANKDAWFVVSAPTAWTESGTNTVIFSLQTADTEDFSGASPETLVATGSIDVADISAGKVLMKVRIPVGVKKYLRGYKTVTGNSGANYITAASLDANIVLDAEINRELA